MWGIGGSFSILMIYPNSLNSYVESISRGSLFLIGDVETAMAGPNKKVD